MTVQIGIKKLHPAAKEPTYGTKEAAGADLYAVVEDIEVAGKTFPQVIILEPGQRKMIRTGLALEIPEGFEGQVRPRSGLAFKNGITIVNAPGTIDSDYRGEICVILLNTSDEGFMVNTGDRIAQLVIAPVSRASFHHTGGNLSATQRGEGGFGSTGTN